MYNTRPREWIGFYQPRDYQYRAVASSKVHDFFTAGDYQTVIELLTDRISTPSINNSNQLEPNDLLHNAPREHALLVRTMCYLQQREFSRVVADATEVLKSNQLISSSPTKENQDLIESDRLFARVLALWFRSLALESLEKWELAKSDLTTLKTLALQHSNIVYRTDGLLQPLLPSISPLIAMTNSNTVFINLQCVTERLRRMSTLVTKEIARRKDPGQVFRLIDDDSKNCHELVKKFHYRLLLRKPIHPYIHLNMWYALDLVLVSEMGLFKREDMDDVDGYKLECKVLDIGHEEGKKFKVHVRAMSAEDCEWSGLTEIKWAGVQSDGKGGLEFMIEKINSDSTNEDVTYAEALKSKKKSTGTGRKREPPGYGSNFYLQVYPVMEMISGNREGNKVFNDHLLVPLVIGPINISDCRTRPLSCGFHGQSPCASTPDHQAAASVFWTSPKSGLKRTAKSDRDVSWSGEDYLVHNFRAFKLPNGKHLLIKELWDYGIPGKVWDSAFIIVQLFKDWLLRDPTTLRGKRILDLSTGTGFVGLYLAALVAGIPDLPKTTNALSEKNSKTHFVLTDLEDPLELIRKNRSLNRHLFANNERVTIDVEALRWGDISKIRLLRSFDVVLASDVVYEPELFDALINTLISVCTPGRTKIYLGYKRRGLSEDEENLFFTTLKSKLQMRLLEHAANEGKVCVYELWK